MGRTKKVVRKEERDMSPLRLSDQGGWSGQSDLVFELERGQTEELDPRIVWTPEKAIELIRWILEQTDLSFDVETTGLDIKSLSLAGFGVSSTTEGFYVPVAHKRMPSLAKEWVIKILKAVLKVKRIIGHHLQFDLACLAVCLGGMSGGVEIVASLPQVFDTYWASYFLDQERDGGNGLKNMSRIILGKQPKTFAQALVQKAGKTSKSEYADILESDPNTIADYCIEDCINSACLVKPLEEALTRWGLIFNYVKQKMPLLKLLVRMKLTGIRVDVERILLNEKPLLAAKKQLLRDIEQMCPTLVRLNQGITKAERSKRIIDSPKRLGEFLFNLEEDGGLGLEMKAKRTDNGQADVSEEHLEMLKDDNPVIGKILEYRALMKIISTYIEGGRKELSNEDFFYPDWSGADTRTMRLCAKSPNMMNWPSKPLEVTVDGQKTKVGIREFIIPNKGYIFWIGDYKQLELRLLTILCREQVFIDSFLEELDPHMMVAGMMELLEIPVVVNAFGHLYKQPDNEEQNERRKKLFKAKDSIDHLRSKKEAEAKARGERLDKPTKERIVREAGAEYLEPLMGQGWEEAWKFITDRRNEAKTLVYGILYGATEHKIAAELGIRPEEAVGLIDRFYKGLLSVKKFTEEAHKFILRNGYARTILGSIRWLKGWAGNMKERASALRQGFNFLMQGLAMEMITLAMLRIDTDKVFIRSASRILMQIHDELVIEIPEDWEDRFPTLPKRIAELMTDPFGGVVKFPVPLGIDWALKERWSK